MSPLSPLLLVKRVLLAMVAAFALVYAGDALWLRLRMSYPRAGAPFGYVQIERFYAIPQKNGSTEYEMDGLRPEVTQSCVRSLFPHFHYGACWYLERNRQKPIPMLILPRIGLSPYASPGARSTPTREI